MPNILHLDESAVAGAAMKGILDRAGHCCVTASTIQEAWQQLRDLICIDLVILELRLRGENGMSFIQQLRADCWFKDIPIVVCSTVSDHGTVQKALSLRIQGYLTKPFEDDAIYSEVKKAAAYPWRATLFEEERSFCVQLGLTPTSLRKMREELMAAVEAAMPGFAKLGERPDSREAERLIVPLKDSAEAAGVWAVANYLQELQTKADEGNWAAFKRAGEGLDLSRRMTYCHLNPDYLPDGFFSAEERKAKEEARERVAWIEADKSGGLPLATADATKARLDALTECPVVDTAAAALQMRADGTVSSLNPVMDLVSKDPGLSAQVLVEANKLEREEKTVVEDPRAAVALLGEIRLNALAKAIPIVPERHLNFPPFSWAQFWMFQVGTGHAARFTCDAMEFRDIPGDAYTAGLLHDLGKILLFKLYPFCMEAALKYAKEQRIPAAEAERRFVGLSTWEMAEHFARKNGLPKPYVSVIRWVDKPAEATEDVELVAAVSLARHLCISHRVGFCGVPGDDTAVEETPAWAILKELVFPSFNLRKFEYEARNFCLNLKHDLSGREGVREPGE